MTADDGSAPPETDPVPAAPATAHPSAPEPAVGAADEAVHGVDDVLGREVALVTLRPVSGEALRTRVDRIRRLARLHHPHLVEVYDVDGLDDDAEHVLVLESVGGRPLDEVAAGAPLPLGRVAEIGARVASALAQAHRHGVVHGRLGPASILVEDDQRVWLVGLTASLQDEADGRRPGDGAVTAAASVDAPVQAGAPGRADDLRALAATLAAVAAPADATELAGVLGEARHGGGSADELSGRLLRLARRDSAPTDTTGAVYAPAESAGGGMRRLTARALAGAGTVAVGAGASGAAAAAAAPAAAPGGNGPVGAATPGSDGPARRPARRLAGGARVATLAAVALLLALTSGVVIWGQETRGWFGAAQSEPEAAAPAPPPAPVLPPLPVTVPGSPSASRSSDRGGARSESSESSESERSSRSTGAGGSEGSRAARPSRAPAPGPVPPAPPVPTPGAPATTVPPTTPPTTSPSPTTEPAPSTEPGTPSTAPTQPSAPAGSSGSSSGRSTAPDDPPTPSGTGADGADGQQGSSSSASPSTRTADPDAGTRA